MGKYGYIFRLCKSIDDSTIPQDIQDWKLTRFRASPGGIVFLATATSTSTSNLGSRFPAVSHHGTPNPFGNHHILQLDRLKLPELGYEFQRNPTLAMDLADRSHFKHI